MRYGIFRVNVLGCIALILTFVAATFGCARDVTGSQSPDSEQSTGTQFEWDTSQPVPHWRDDSPIEWYGTDEQAEVFQEARSTGKPILCYVSQYMDLQTEELESEILSGEGWGNEIQDRFVPWEINYWEDPALALLIGGSAAQTMGGLLDAVPSLIILRPPSRDSGLPSVVRIWAGDRLLDFPVFGSELTVAPGTIQADSLFDNLAGQPGVAFTYSGGNLGLTSYDAVKQTIEWNLASLHHGNSYPILFLCDSFNRLSTGNSIGDLAREIATWSSRVDEIDDTNMIHGLGFDGFPFIDSMPFHYYVPGNLQATECAATFGLDYPVALDLLFGELFRMVATDDGTFEGGFAPYLDDGWILEEHEDNSLLDTLLEPPNTPLLPLNEASMGPRDIVWVNAFVLSSWLQLAYMDPDLGRVILPSGESTAEFLDAFAPVLLEVLEDRLDFDQPASIPLADRIYMLRLYNTLYRSTGDRSLLEKAGTIAATFPHDVRAGTVEAIGPHNSPEEWYDLAYVPLIPDLALSLNEYGWLADDPEARATGSQLPDEALSLQLLSTGAVVSMTLGYVHDVVDSSCIHIGVVAPVDDPVGRELLNAALEGWDPRKVVQILDPERDADLVERFGFDAVERPVAYVAIDEEIYLHADNPDELRAIILDAQALLVQQSTTP